MSDDAPATQRDIQQLMAGIQELKSGIERQERTNNVRLRSQARQISLLDERLSPIEERVLDLECGRLAA